MSDGIAAVGGFAAALAILERILSAAVSPGGVRIALWILAFIFVLAGTAKLRRPAEAAVAMVNFGIVSRIRPLFGQGLGSAEVGIAVALIVAPSVGAPIAMALVWLFVVLIAQSLLAGRQFPCFCFGEAVPLSRWILIRTLLLAMLASGVFILGSSHVTLSVNALAMVTAAAILGVIVIGSQVPQLLRWNATAAGG